uniref:NYN domain-containing protein n=1 Tax=Helicotheca tamesis TaxID=374047 RepID=A0A7S2MIT5_9STRA|mmetsp:Transcript_1683/g.2440  ORF Transcript_1683/g.2440 Transcript_1683/m.2440 type:complete len:186 (+) Transcript_1683:117-674(+)
MYCPGRLYPLLVGMALSSHQSATNNPSVVTWLVDGSNLRCSRGVPHERDSIIEELQKIASPSDMKTTNCRDVLISNVVLVFDGDHNETFHKSRLSSWFQYIVTDGKDKQKDRGDDYIIEQALPELKDLDGRVHLVTADKDLGKRARATGIMKGGSIVHPPKFWKQYLPNLQVKQNRNEVTKSRMK